MAATILVVEDDPDLAQIVRYNLEAEGFAVTTVSDGGAADMLVGAIRPELVLLDLMLPNVSGLELCRRWRQRPELVDMRIIMVTAKSDTEDRVAGLETGADDYVPKPFSVPELVARVKAQLRRALPESPKGRVVAGDIELDPQSHRVRRGGRELHLGPTEFRMLEHFIANQGRVVSRDQLIAGVWPRRPEIDARTVDVHVGRLRKALNAGRKQDPIQTVRGIGYRMDPVPPK